MKSPTFYGKADDVAMYPLKNSCLDVSALLDVIDDVSCYHVRLLFDLMERIISQLPTFAKHFISFAFN